MDTARQRTYGERWQALQDERGDMAEWVRVPSPRRRRHRWRGVARMMALAIGAWMAWQCAGIVADGAVGCGIGTACAHAATVENGTRGDGCVVVHGDGNGYAVCLPRSTHTVGRCIAVDTARNMVTMGHMRYRYADMDGIVWRRPTPRHVRAAVQAMVSMHLASGMPSGPWRGRMCVRVATA